MTVIRNFVLYAISHPSNIEYKFSLKMLTNVVTDRAEVESFEKGLGKIGISKNFSSLIIIIILAQTPEIGQGRGRFLSCGARKPEQT